MIADKAVFITGGAGFIGSTLAGRLWITTDRALRQPRPQLAAAQPSRRPPELCVWCKATSWTTSMCAAAMQGADIVVHCAAIAGIDTVIKSPVTHHAGQHDRLRQRAGGRSQPAALRPGDLVLDQRGVRPAGVPVQRRADKTVMGKVGEARWTYAVSKLADEHLAHRLLPGERAARPSLRPFNVYGPGQVGEGALRTFIIAGPARTSRSRSTATAPRSGPGATWTTWWTG